jgi:ferredoxin
VRVTVKVNADECVGCENCVPVCPTEAITIVDGKAVIDQKKCNQCLTCIEECPTDAIHEE